MKITIALLLASTLATQSLFALEWTKKPTLTRVSGKTVIEFGVDQQTDVAVYILNAKGDVVRHLVAGVLGDKAPAPFQSGLSQKIEWDGNDNDGKPAVGGPFKVRVAAGLKPTFDRFLMYNPDAVPRFKSMAVGQGGEVYVFHFDSVSNGMQGGLKIRVLDREGRYKRMLLPFPADLPYEKVKAMRALQDEEGRIVPRLQNYHTLSLWPDTLHNRGRSMATTCPAVDSKGGVHWMIAGGRIVSLDSRGGCSYPELLSEPLFPGDATLVMNGGKRAGFGGRLTLAVGEDDKYLYIAGMQRSEKGKKTRTAVPCVYRVKLDTRNKPEVFAGKPDEAGHDGKLLTAPTGLAAANGLVYVADAQANRVVAFSEKDGSLAGEIKTHAPNFVGVDPKKGTVYVVGGPNITIPTLTKFDGIKTGKEVCKVNLPRSSHTKVMNHSMAVDTSQEKVRIWVSVKPYTRYRMCAVDDEGTSLKVNDTFLKQMTKWSRIPQDLTVDRKRDELYVRGYTRLDATTGEIKGKLFNGRRQGKGQVVACADGSLVTMCNRVGLRRWTRDGKPLAWEGAPDNSAKYSGVTEVIMTLGPLNNLTVRGNELYVVNAGSGAAKGQSKNLEVRGMDGKLKRVAVYGCHARSIPRVDARGNIYLAAPVRPKGQFCTEYLADKVDRPKGYHTSYNYVYASIVKFPPSGGAMYFPNTKGGAIPSSAVPEEIKKKPSLAFSHPVKAFGGLAEGSMRGAEWMRMGFAPFSATWGGGTYACHCENGGFDVDPFGRVFYPNLGEFRVEMVDTNNNWLGSFGHYGNQDSGGKEARVKVPEIPLAWPAYVAVSDKYAYVSDSINLRIVRVKLGYRIEEVVALE